MYSKLCHCGVTVTSNLYSTERIEVIICKSTRALDCIDQSKRQLAYSAINANGLIF